MSHVTCHVMSHPLQGGGLWLHWYLENAAAAAAAAAAVAAAARAFFYISNIKI